MHERFVFFAINSHFTKKKNEFLFIASVVVYLLPYIYRLLSIVHLLLYIFDVRYEVITALCNRFRYYMLALQHTPLNYRALLCPMKGRRNRV